MQATLHDNHSGQVTWERWSVHEHRARCGSRLVGLITRPAAGVFWAHRVSFRPESGRIVDHGPKTRHRTLTAAKSAIEESAPSDSTTNAEWLARVEQLWREDVGEERPPDRPLTEGEKRYYGVID